jgi:preprotein translocase subunit SecD
MGNWWKPGIILAVIALSVFYIIPPSERINLGLDLRGGTHIVLQVDTDSAVEYELNLTQTRIGQALTDRGITYDSIVPVEPTVMEIRRADPGRAADVREILDQQVGNWAIRDLGEGTWRLVMPPEVRQYIANAAVTTTLNTVRNRVDQLGVREPIVQKQGLAGDRILIQLPGVEDPERAVDVMIDQGLLEWKAVTYPPGVTDFSNWGPPSSREAVAAMFGGAIPDDTDLYPQQNTAQDGSVVTVWWPLKRVSVVIGNDLRNAFRSDDQYGQPQVSFELTKDAGDRFQAATQANLGRRMAIVLTASNMKSVISAPTIQDVIRDQGRIHGGFTVERAEDLALQLRSGAIPAKVQILEERTVGPSLGQDSIRSGVAAATLGFLGVMVFMVIYYRLSGINAVVALALNVLLLLGAMGYFAATLTLPGIAGLILTVGMSVDSNVLIFERIREELRLGKTVRSAVDQGFGRAFATIIDVHVTTLVSAFFLFSYGTGPVKGFAVTLTIGLVASVFTAVFVSRQMFELVLGRGRRVESLSI